MSDRLSQLNVVSAIIHSVYQQTYTWYIKIVYDLQKLLSGRNGCNIDQVDYLNIYTITVHVTYSREVNIHTPIEAMEKKTSLGAFWLSLIICIVPLFWKFKFSDSINEDYAIFGRPYMLNSLASSLNKI